MPEGGRDFVFAMDLLAVAAAHHNNRHAPTSPVSESTGA